MTPTSVLASIAKEVGLKTIYSSPFDTKLLCIARFIRLFAYGGSTLILALYLRALDISQTRIGLFMTLTLWGDVPISLLLTLYADRMGRKVVMCIGASLMIISGIIFAICGNYWVLVAASVVGVISPSGNEIGPFRAVEESTLAHLTPKEVRADVFAWYMLIGSAGSSLGLLVCGWVMAALKGNGWDDVSAYRAVFWAYAGAGFVKLLLSLSLSRNVEADVEPAKNVVDEAERPLLGDRVETQATKKKPSLLERLFPHISRESMVVLSQLCLLFALDSFASGLASMSWITYYFKIRYMVADGQLGTLFAVTSIIAALSSLVAASLARRIGNVKTMVFTHLPSAIALAMIPIPQYLWASSLFLILRSCTQSMDAAPRSAFLAAIVLPNERTAVMGIVNLVKTFSQSFGPGITGLLFESGKPWVMFVMAGSLKATYDLGILAVFQGHVTKEDKADAQRQVTRATGGEGSPQTDGDVDEEER